jgi:hypothetical protein
MKECKDCELAIYCFSEPSTWIFRTKQEMDEKRSAMLNCPHQEEVRRLRAGVARDCSEARAS